MQPHFQPSTPHRRPPTTALRLPAVQKCGTPDRHHQAAAAHRRLTRISGHRPRLGPLNMGRRRRGKGRFVVPHSYQVRKKHDNPTGYCERAIFYCKNVKLSILFCLDVIGLWSLCVHFALTMLSFAHFVFSLRSAYFIIRIQKKHLVK